MAIVFSPLPRFEVTGSRFCRTRLRRSLSPAWGARFHPHSCNASTRIKASASASLEDPRISGSDFDAGRILLLSHRSGIGRLHGGRGGRLIGLRSGALGDRRSRGGIHAPLVRLRRGGGDLLLGARRIGGLGLSSGIGGLRSAGCALRSAVPASASGRSSETTDVAEDSAEG